MSEPILSRVHQALLLGFVRAGYPPTADELAASLGVPRAAVFAALQTLHEIHGLVLHPGTTEVWLAHPFSATPTAVWVAGPERGWWAPCLWCALGITALTASTARIHVRLGGEHEEMVLRVADGEVVDDVVVHFALPPRRA